jgi:arsenate reductase-like glutaredoxin family protein
MESKDDIADLGVKLHKKLVDMNGHKKLVEDGIEKLKEKSWKVTWEIEWNIKSRKWMTRTLNKWQSQLTQQEELLKKKEDEMEEIDIKMMKLTGSSAWRRDAKNHQLKERKVAIPNKEQTLGFKDMNGTTRKSLVEQVNTK